MAGKFMSLKKVIIPVMTLIIMVSQLTGCAAMDSKEMVKMIDSGQTITLEVAKPSYAIKVLGEQQQDLSWVQLDQLKTFNNGFRQSFDEIFNINIVTDNNINGKSGCLYVDETGDRNGNTTLEDAFRNKTFVTKYWNDTAVKSKIAKTAADAFTDIGGSDSYAIAGAINAYYNLLPDAENPSSFNPTQSLSREDFYTLVYKTQEGVKDVKADTAFETAVGGATDYTKFAQGVDEFGFLSVTNKSLDGASYKGSISRAEAIYMVVNENFPDQLAKVTGKEKAYTDTKNAGDLALKAGFKAKNDAKEIVSKDRWQSYTLAYMLQHPDKGMQEDLYKTMVVAHNLGLVSGDESRWDEPISKAESIMLIANVQLAKNKTFGYLSEAEYGKINPAKFKTATEEAQVIGKTSEGLNYGDGWTDVRTSQVPTDPAKKLSSGMTLWEAKLKIDHTVKSLESKGYKIADMKDLIDSQCKDMGTTYEEIQRLPAENNTGVQTPAKQTQTPSKQTDSGSKTTTPSKPSTGSTTPSNGGNSGAVDPAFAGHDSSGGTSTSIPGSDIGISGGN